jgi:TolA-binding protein
MDQSVKDKSWSGRAFSSGIANRWDVPIGKVVDQYADAYLKKGFNSFSEIGNLGQKPSHDILIKVTDVNYYMSSQAAHCDLAFSIENTMGRQVFEKKYHEEGPSEMGKIAVGGVFAQKSAIRQSTNVVLENIFKKLLADIQADYKDWSQPQPQFQTSPQPTNTFKEQIVSASEYNRRGFEYYKNANYNQAIKDFTIALSMENNPSYYINRGSSFYELKQYDNAISDFKQAINLAPNEAGAYAWCGNVYYVKKSYYEASEYFSKAIAIVPNNAVLYLNRGQAQFKIGNKSMAASDFKKACELGNEDGCKQLKVLENK